MKKISLLVCLLLILRLLCACTDKKEDFHSPVNFYYCKEEISYNSTSGVIQAEVREGAAFYDNLTALLHSYLLGPQSEELQSPIPAEVYLVSCSIDADAVNIELSSQFARLSGVKLTTACSALLLTVHDYTGIQALNIRAKDSKLDDKETFTIHVDDVILLDAVTTVQ